MGCDDMAQGRETTANGSADATDADCSGPETRGERTPPFDLPDDRTLDGGRESSERRTRPGNCVMEIGVSWIELTAGNVAAADWMMKWVKYCHAIDDLIDELFSPELLLDVLAQAVELYSHPFYMAHVNHLRPIVIAVTNCYADSVKWEGSDKPDEQLMADVLRLAGVEMYCVVAGICGGYAHMRKLSGQIRKHTWAANHDSQGNPH